MYASKFEQLLGVETHSEFLGYWCAHNAEFAKHTWQGYTGWPGESFAERMRHCLVGLAKAHIGVYDSRVKVLLASVRPDVEYPDIAPPWKVLGAAEGIRTAVESYLLSEVDAKKASEQIAQTIHATPWRKEHNETTTSAGKQIQSSD